MVAARFVVPCQRRLFRSIVLTTDPAHFATYSSEIEDILTVTLGRAVKMGTLPRAFNLLAGSPHLAAYVSDLTITFHRGEDPNCVDSVIDVLDRKSYARRIYHTTLEEDVPGYTTIVSSHHTILNHSLIAS